MMGDERRPSEDRMSESPKRLDDAARAGWLYYIAGKTQDDIARTLNVSRPSAQRLVSLCRSDGLITFRVNHPISACMNLAGQLADRHALTHCDVVPSAADGPATLGAVAGAAAIFIERLLRKDQPSILAVGTGRSMRASATRVTPMSRPLHRIVSLAGNISPDGSASPYNALEKLAEITGAQAFPMPLPMHVTDAALYQDAFITRDELLDLMRNGAVGATLAWAFDVQGRILEHEVNHRVTSVRPGPSGKPRICVAHGAHKARAMRAALEGRLINGLITDEATARVLLE